MSDCPSLWHSHAAAGDASSTETIGSVPPQITREQVVAIIPARYASSRFPGKAIVDIAGKPMIQWVYERTAQGRAAPLRVIGGPKSMVSDLGGPFAIFSSTRKIVASMNGNLEEELATPESFVGVWSLDANGDVAPEYTLGGPHGVLQMVRGVALNPKHKEVIVTDKRMNAVLTFSFPEIF